MSIRRIAFTAASVAVLCSACAPEPEAAPEVRTVSFDDVTDETGSDYYTVASPIVGVVDEVGSRVTVPFEISNPNGIVFNPKVVIQFQDGATVTCQETDLRRLPSVQETTTEWDLPCAGDLPDDVSGATAVVTDEYH